ncbi:hypothetical protein UFOVP36_55 [uncultured Caudovirales phage]|uniref:Uncharacterized protein n=1 Tax=uncultured Caudovirales phage TaxID=2100421 RepID=A0A6J5KJZ0_9CAUD|nr:hypothetical protein UFOVP36_55 [uncultured Caudovirales phage]
MLLWKASYTDPTTGTKYDVEWVDGYRSELGLMVSASNRIDKQHGIVSDINKIRLWDAGRVRP